MAKKKTSFRSTSRRLTLEPRLLFDGAGAVAAVDAIHQDQDADQHTSSFDTRCTGCACNCKHLRRSYAS